MNYVNSSEGKVNLARNMISNFYNVNAIDFSIF